jgi:hypothetical protein
MTSNNQGIASLPRPIPPSLTPEQRARCATAIGADLIEQARRLANWEFDWGPDSIRLREVGLPMDVRSLWISQRLEKFHRQLVRFVGSDFASGRWVGRRLRRRVAGLLRDAIEMAAFAEWLYQFDGDSLAGCYAVWTSQFAQSAARLVVLATSDDANELLQTARELEDGLNDAFDWAFVLNGYLGDDFKSPPDEPDVAEQLFGVAPLEPVENRAAAMRAYPGGAERLVEIAAPQFRVVWPGGLRVPRGSADNLVILALKLGAADVPLYANRVASLVGQLVQRAASVNAGAVGASINDFHRQQAGRIIAAGDRYWERLRLAYEAPDGIDILDAYHTLSEGVLRPYGSLLVGLTALADGHGSRTYRELATLGELKDLLGVSRDELVALADLCLDPALRNYRAHEDVVRTASGVWAIVLDGGETIDIDLPDVHWKTRLMRAFLDGVDVAVQVASINLADLAGPAPGAPVLTEALVRMFASVFGGRLTGGSVTDLEIRDGVATLDFDGPWTAPQLELLAIAMRRFIGPSMAVRVRRPAGLLLFESAGASTAGET